MSIIGTTGLIILSTAFAGPLEEARKVELRKQMQAMVDKETLASRKGAIKFSSAYQDLQHELWRLEGPGEPFKPTSDWQIRRDVRQELQTTNSDIAELDKLYRARVQQRLDQNLERRNKLDVLMLTEKTAEGRARNRREHDMLAVEGNLLRESQKAEGPRSREETARNSRAAAIKEALKVAKADTSGNLVIRAHVQALEEELLRLEPPKSPLTLEMTSQAANLERLRQQILHARSDDLEASSRSKLADLEAQYWELTGKSIPHGSASLRASGPYLERQAALMSTCRAGWKSIWDVFPLSLFKTPG